MRVNVVLKSNGRKGSVEEKDFNPNTMYKDAGGQAQQTEEPNALSKYIYSESRAPIAEELEGRGFPQSLVGGALWPGEMGTRLGLGTADALGGLLTGDTQKSLAGERNMPFLNQEQEAAIKNKESPLPFMKEGAKAGLGLGSYAFPPGKGAMALVTGGIRGVAASASREDASPADVAISGVAGAGVEGLLANLVPYLGRRGKELLTRANVKRLGKPTMSEGGVPSVENWSELGFDTRGIDELGNSAKIYTKENGGKIAKVSKALSDDGYKVDKTQIVSYLEEKVKKAATVEMKKPVNKLLKNVKKSFGKRDSVSLKEFYEMKKEWGSLGKWNAQSPPKEQQIARSYNDLYIKANDIMEELFEKGLPEESANLFRDINRKLSAAQDIKHFTKRMELVKTPEGYPIGINNTLRALLDNPNMLRTVGKTYETASKTPQKLQDFLTKGTSIGVGKKEEAR